MSLISAAAKLAIKPKGPVELAIFDHIWQQTPVETVLAALMEAEVFYYADNSGGSEPKPLVTQGNDGKPGMLVFTTRERSAAIAKQMPDPSAAPVSTPFREILKWAPVELGLIVNLGTALAAEATSAHLDALRRQAGIFRP
jgi:hypothetical protein